MKYPILFFLFLGMQEICSAQKTHTFYTELGGYSGYLALNYELEIVPQVTGRVGYGIFGNKAISVQKYFGNKVGKLELGVGAGEYRMYNGDLSATLVGGIMGVRLDAGPVLLKVNVNPLIWKNQEKVKLFAWPGVSGGIQF